MTPFVIIGLIVFIPLLVILLIALFSFIYPDAEQVIQNMSTLDCEDLYVKRLHVDSKLPVRNHWNDAGLDLFAIDNCEIKAGTGLLINTGIAIELPPNSYGKIEDRSSMGVKLIKVMGGVIDEQYRGEIKVMLANLSSQDIFIKKHDKIAQLIIIPILYSKAIETEVLSNSDRDNKGFGSSGI